MISFFKKRNIDSYILFSLIPLFVIGLSTLHTFSIGENTHLFFRQLIFITISLLLFFIFSFFDFSFLKRPRNVVFLYLVGIALLVFVLFFGSRVNGARSWINLSLFSFQPADFMKFALVVLFAKYLARRHLVIHSFRQVFFTFFYFFIPFFLIFLQPDFGSALILLSIWFGIVLISGLSKKHFFTFLIIGFIALSGLWTFVFKDYQKKRILTFIHPLADTRGAGYNAYQSVIAVGSGKMMGKGVGYGTQSRLSYLPEHETDFIFAAIAEEWGFIGSMIVLMSFFIIIFRLLSYIPHFRGNFERIFTLGFVFFLLAHLIVNIGMNIGLLPVTGVPLPFVSYGGSHLLIEFLFLAVIMSFRSHRENLYIYKEDSSDKFLF